jgi:hypothetical protein
MTADTNSRLDYPTENSKLKAAADFVLRVLADSVADEHAEYYVYRSVAAVLEERSLLARAGRLSDILAPPDRNAVAEAVCALWDELPRQYHFLFPLPGVAFELDATITPGVDLVTVDRSEVDWQGMSTRPGHAPHDIEAGSVSAMRVTGAGLVQFGGVYDPPVATAIRRAKIVLQLGEVERVFRFEPFLAFKFPPRMAKYSPPFGIEGTTGEVNLPAGFANAVTEIIPWRREELLGPMRVDHRLDRVGTVLAGDEECEKHHDLQRSRPKADDPVNQHCARIATAAEWLFDSEHEVQSATTFVQAAIALESLYGGDVDEPVGKTLSNRLAYALGKSPQEREQLHALFESFYKTRSRVVHSGVSRLNVGARQQLLEARTVLKKALAHELSLIG